MIDVIVTSTCRKHFEATYASFIKNVKYDDGFNFVVNIDVLERSKHYLPRLLEFLKYNSIKDINVNTEEHTFANAVNYLHKRLQSKYYFHLEDDWIFLKSIDLNKIIQVMNGNKNIHSVRFSKEKIKKPNSKMVKSLAKSKELYLLPGEQVNIDGIDLIKTSIWSLNPHIARTSIVKHLTGIPGCVNPESFLSKRYYGKFNSSGAYIYGKYGDPPYTKDIGRPCYLVKKARAIIEIIRVPSLIERENRIKKHHAYIGRPFKEKR